MAIKEKYFLLFTAWLSKINSFWFYKMQARIQFNYFYFKQFNLLPFHNLLVLSFNKENRLHNVTFGIAKRFWKYHFQPNIYCMLSPWTGSLVWRIIISDYQSEGWMCWSSFFCWLHCFSKFIVLPMVSYLWKGALRNKTWGEK